MDNHWQRVVHCVSNSHAACSKLEQHFICQKRRNKRNRLWKFTYHMGKSSKGQATSSLETSNLSLSVGEKQHNASLRRSSRLFTGRFWIIIYGGLYEVCLNCQCITYSRWRSEIPKVCRSISSTGVATISNTLLWMETTAVILLF